MALWNIFFAIGVQEDGTIVRVIVVIVIVDGAADEDEFDLIIAFDVHRARQGKCVAIDARPALSIGADAVDGELVANVQLHLAVLVGRERRERDGVHSGDGRSEHSALQVQSVRVVDAGDRERDRRAGHVTHLVHVRVEEQRQQARVEAGLPIFSFEQIKLCRDCAKLSDRKEKDAR